jgi:hypothetical protein
LGDEIIPIGVVLNESVAGLGTRYSGLSLIAIAFNLLLMVQVGRMRVGCGLLVVKIRNSVDVLRCAGLFEFRHQKRWLIVDVLEVGESLRGIKML